MRLNRRGATGSVRDDTIFGNLVRFCRMAPLFDQFGNEGDGNAGPSPGHLPEMTDIARVGSAGSVIVPSENGSSHQQACKDYAG